MENVIAQHLTCPYVMLHVTVTTDILIFNRAHTLFPSWCDFLHLFHCHCGIFSREYQQIHSVATVTNVHIYWGNVFCLQRNLETPGTQSEAATQADDVGAPVPEEQGPTDDIEPEEGGNM
jgi:hypothetical protein